MNLDPTAEQRELAVAAQRFLAAELPVTTLERRAGAGHTSSAAGHSAGTTSAGAFASSAPAGAGASSWQKMARLGWFAIGAPDDRGGAGGSLADQALLFRELGRGLAPGPLLGTALGVVVAALAGRDDVAGSLMAGETTAALAEPWRDPSAMVARSAGVSGRYRVLDGEDATYVTVVTPAGACLVSAEAVRSASHVLPAPDPSVSVSLAHLSEVPTDVAIDSTALAATVAARGQVLAAALLVGILEAVRDMSVAYVSVREQFGKPIGSFQAVKHRCADMAVRAEAAGSLLWLAALSLEKAALAGDAGPSNPAGGDSSPSNPAGSGASPSEALRLAASVKALASEYAVASAHDNVQNHGGMGFTAECPAHLYVKRALEWSVTLGAPEILLSEVVR